LNLYLLFDRNPQAGLAMNDKWTRLIGCGAETGCYLKVYLSRGSMEKVRLNQRLFSRDRYRDFIDEHIASVERVNRFN